MCQPYKYHQRTQKRNVSRRVINYIIPVIITSVILNLPKFFETKIVYNTQHTPVDMSLLQNDTQDQVEMLLKLMQSETNTVTYEMTELRDNPDYIRYSVLSSGIIQIISGIVY